MSDHKNNSFIRITDYACLDQAEEKTKQDGKWKKLGSEEKVKELYQQLGIANEECNKGKQGKIYILSGDKEAEREDEVRIVKRLYNKGPMTQQYIGLVKFNETTIFIGSRFDNEDNNFTNYILEKALNIRSFIFPEMSPEVNRECALQKLLAIILVKQINEAYKKGIFRQYRVYEENNDKIKGKIDIARHIKLNPICNGKIAYSYREYTIDNDINRLIFTALSLLKKKEKSLMNNLFSNNRDVKNYFNQLSNVMQPASRQEIPKLIKKTIKGIHHSIYRCWDDARQTAILILRHVGVSISDEGQDQIYGVLLNMNHMWEEYLNTIWKQGNGTKNVSSQERKDIIFEEKNSTPKRILQPDFCWKEESVTKLVLDAKYKSSWSDIASKKKETKWPREDVYQLLSYMYSFKCNGGIVCPCLESADNADNSKEYNMTYEEGDLRKIYVLPLRIPKASKDFENFERQMQKAEEKLRDEVRKILEKSSRTNS